MLALGDLSYNGNAECWLELIEPFSEKTKIIIGNHELDSSKLLDDYMEYFDLEEQYYSFNYENVHFLVLSAETHLMMILNNMNLLSMILKNIIMILR